MAEGQCIPLDHVCQCRKCKPDAFPAIPHGPAHYILIDWLAYEIGTDDADLHITLGGVPSTRFHIEFNGVSLTEPQPASYPTIVEAQAGVIGWYVYDLHHSFGRHWFPFKCRCGSKLPCCAVEFGRVRLKPSQGTHRWYDGLHVSTELW